MGFDGWERVLSVDSKGGFSFSIDDDGVFCDPDHGDGCTLGLSDYEYYDYFELNKTTLLLCRPLYLCHGK